MSKVYLFAVMLLAASFTGCIEGGDELEKSTSPDEEEDETIEPVGQAEDNETNQPPLVTAGIWMDDDDFMYVDETTLIGDKYLYVSWSAVDVDGTIADAGFDTDLDMQVDVGVGSDSGTIIDSTMNSDHFPGALSVPLNQGWNFERLEFSEDGDLYCSLVMHRTFAFVAVDDDGASSAQLIHYVFPNQFDGDHMDDGTVEVLGIPDDDVDWVTGETSDCSVEEEEEEGPAITFFVQESSDGVYHVDVIKVNEQRPLEDYSFYLKDTTGSTYVGSGHGFGEIAMQIIGGEEHGIDMAYDGGDEQLERRAANVSDDDGSAFPVHFNDNDRDGMLSAGDQFLVYGSGNAANGPAADNWRLAIVDDSTGEIAGSAAML